MEPLLTLRQTAERLAVADITVRRLIDSGEITAYRVGKVLRIPAESVAAYLESRAVGGAR